MKTFQGLVMGVLIAAVGVLGYLYYEESKSDVSISIDPPKVDIN